MNTNQPYEFIINRKENAIMVRGPQLELYWDNIFETIETNSLTGILAPEIPAAAIAGIPKRITKINCGGLTDDALLQLEHQPQLERLDLGNWHSIITDRGLQVLRHLKNLRSFDMAWAQRVTDAGLSLLSHCDQLEVVNLHGTNSGDGVLKALTGKHHLRKFTAGMRVTDAGLEYLQQYPVFAAWQGGEIKFDLIAYQAEPNHLMFGGTFTDAGLTKLQGLNGLIGLTFLGNNNKITGQGIASLASLSKLTFFSLDGDQCTDDVMEVIGKFPHLRMLLAQGAIASDEGFASLAKSKTIEYIWGRECPNFGSRGFEALATMPALRGLAVSCKFVDDAALSSLSRFPALKEFMPMDVGDEAFRHIGACEQLEALTCMYCRDTTDKATEYIGGLKNLKTYYAGKTLITNRSLEILGKMDSLEIVRFWNISGITAEGLEWLAKLPNLKEVVLDGCINITQEATLVFPKHVTVQYTP